VGTVWLAYPGAPQRRYFREDALNAEVFRDGWTRTGDTGYLDDEGYLYLVDRTKDIINKGGVKISSIEIEMALYEHPSVGEAAVFPISHAVLGEEVAAAVVCKSEVSADELRGFLRERLADYKIPRKLLFVDALPRNSMGKVLKRDLRSSIETLAPDSAEYRAPSNDTERAVCSVIESILHLEAVGVDDDLFDLGMDSLSITQMISRLRGSFDLDVLFSEVFTAATVSELARQIDRPP
jgi:acyl carrier protein